MAHCSEQDLITRLGTIMTNRTGLTRLGVRLPTVMCNVPYITRLGTAQFITSKTFPYNKARNVAATCSFLKYNKARNWSRKMESKSHNKARFDNKARNIGMSGTGNQNNKARSNTKRVVVLVLKTTRLGVS